MWFPQLRNRGRDYGNCHFFQAITEIGKKWRNHGNREKKRRNHGNNHLVVGSTAMYLVSLESSFKMKENGVGFRLISARSHELLKF